MRTSKTFESVILLSCLAGSMASIGTMVGATSVLVVGLVLGLGIVGASYCSSDTLAGRAARATDAPVGELVWSRADLAEITRRANLATPRLIAPVPQPNAWATGDDEKTALVCVTAELSQVAR